MENEKKLLRKKIRQKLVEENQNQKEVEKKSLYAQENLLNLEKLKASNNILLFVSYGNEIKTETLLEELLKSGKKVFLPRTEKDDMDFFQISNTESVENQTEIGDFGIVVPKKNLKMLSPKEIGKDFLILIPGLAFDKKGNRLGKGKGFYDKYLENVLQCKSKDNYPWLVGFCYDFQIVDEVPTEKSDIPVDYVVSETRIIKVVK